MAFTHSVSCLVESDSADAAGKRDDCKDSASTVLESESCGPQSIGGSSSGSSATAVAATTDSCGDESRQEKQDKETPTTTTRNAADRESSELLTSATTTTTATVTAASLKHCERDSIKDLQSSQHKQLPVTSKDSATSSQNSHSCVDTCAISTPANVSNCRIQTTTTSSSNTDSTHHQSSPLNRDDVTTRLSNVKHSRDNCDSKPTEYPDKNAAALSRSEEKEMSYKKTLIGDYHNKTEATPTVNSENRHTETNKNFFAADKLAASSGINFDCPLTDQLNKRNKQQLNAVDARDVTKSTTNGLKVQSLKATQNPVTSGHSLKPTTLHTPSSGANIDPHIPLRASATPLEPSGAVTSLAHTKRNNMMNDKRHETDERRRAPKTHAPRPSSSTSLTSSGGSGERKSSPLDFDKSRRVEPYRDPELLKRDELQRLAALHPPSSVNSALAALRPPIPPGVPGLPSISGASGLPPLPGLPSSLHPYAQMHDPTLAMLHLSQLQQQMQLMQDPHMAAAYANPYLAQLELLYRQKNPQRPFPADWMMHPELLRDVPGAAAHRELLERAERDARERERDLREREARERELREREKMRERDERERLERK